MMRPVTDGERLSGHRQPLAINHPEICIFDGMGAGSGSFVCTISRFHGAIVEADGQDTRLNFGGATLVVEGCLVEYDDGVEMPAVRNR